MQDVLTVLERYRGLVDPMDDFSDPEWQFKSFMPVKDIAALINRTDTPTRSQIESVRRAVKKMWETYTECMYVRRTDADGSTKWTLAARVWVAGDGELSAQWWSRFYEIRDSIPRSNLTYSGSRSDD